MKRFWAKVVKTDTCWVWMGSRNPKQYGMFLFNGRMQGAHRVAWQMRNGAIPDGAMVLHHCDNPSCVRVSHLFLGDASVNTLDAIAKGRWVKPNPGKDRCGNGHDLTGDNLIIWHGRRNGCKKCKRNWRRNYDHSNQSNTYARTVDA